MEAVLTVRQRIAAAIAIAVVGVVALVVVPALRDADAPRAASFAEPAAGHTVVRGRILGVPADRLPETRVAVTVEPWSGIDTLVVPMGGGGVSPASEKPTAPVRLLSSGAYQADVTALCAGIEGEAVIRLAARHPACVPVRVQVRARIEGGADARGVIPCDIELPPALDIRGTVSGAGPKLAKVSLFDLTESLGYLGKKEVPRMGRGHWAKDCTTVSPDDRGAFRLRGRRDHLLLVLAHGPARLPAWRLLEPADAASVDVGPLELEVGAHVSGRLKAPAILTQRSVRAWVPSLFGGLELHVGGGRDWFTWTLPGIRPNGQEAAVDESGRFRIEGLPRGFVELRPRFGGCDPPAMTAEGPVGGDEPQPVFAPEDGVELDVRASILRVEIVDAEGEPAEGPFLLQVGDDRVAKRYGKGRREFAVPVEQSYKIDPDPRGPACTPASGTTAAAGGREDVTIRMEAEAAPGRVRFEFPDGAQMARCDVTWTRDGYAPTSGTVYWASLEVGPGRKPPVLDRLPPGQYVFHVTPVAGGEGEGGGWWVDQHAATQVRSGEESVVQIPLEDGGRWEVHVTRADTNAFQRCSVELRLPSGEWTYPTLMYRGAQPDEESVLSWTRGGNPNEGLNPLHPGTYTLEFREPGFVTERRTVTIEARKKSRIVVVLRPD